MEELKAHSSKWMKLKGDEFKNFYWQDGYGAFSVSSSEIQALKTYIDNQHEHHKTVTYQGEYRKFLENYQLEYDERYVWD